jgi:hypothetical protein
MSQGTAVVLDQYKSSAHDRVAAWIQSNRSGTLDPRTLGKVSQSAADALALSIELANLVKAGKLLVNYRVITPMGEISADEFKDPLEIPAQLRDSNLSEFDTANSDIIPVYRVS